MADIKDQLIKDSYNYVLQSDLSTGVVYRIGGTIPVNPIFSSGLTVNSGFTYSNGTEQPGYALLTDGTGYAYWAPVSASTPSSGVTSITVGNGLSASSSTGAVTIVFTGSTSASGDYLPLSGGTVTGATIFQSGLTANTISATTGNIGDYLQFYTGNTNPSNVGGRIFYDNLTNDLAFYSFVDPNVKIKIGKQLYSRVNNFTGSLIPKGSALAIQSATNDIPNVTLPVSSGRTNNQVIGLAAADIPNGAVGLAINQGILLGVNLSYPIGTILYLSDTVPGGYVSGTTELQFSSRSHQIGYVIATGTTTGEIYVSIKNEDTNLTLTDIERNILEGNVISSGVYEYTGMTQGTGSTINIALVRGWVPLNTYQNATLPDVLNIYYSGGTNIPLTNLATADSTFILINSASTVVQQTTFPTPQERRENLFLGKVVHVNRSTITSINQTVDFDVSPMSAIRDLWTPLKLINQGIVVSPHSTTLEINTSAGTLWGNGIGWTTNQLNPDSVSISGTSPTTFQYRSQLGPLTGGSVTTGNTTTINPGYYDLNGVVTAVGGGSNSATNQRIYLFPTGLVRIQLGQKVYGTLAEAVSGVLTEQFVDYSLNRENGILIGIISLNKSATNLTLPAQAVFNFVSKFGEVLGGTGGLSTTTLQQAYDNSTEPEILINSTLDGLSIRNGTGNLDNVTQLLQGQNTAGNVTSFIRADGAISGSTYYGNGTNLTGIFNHVKVNGTTQFSAGTDTFINFSGINVSITSGVNNTLIFSAGTGGGNSGVDVYVTGGTYNGSQILFTNNTGGTFSVTGLTASGFSANYYGSFSDNRNQPLSGANTATVWKYNTTEISNGISVSGESRIVVQNKGIYEIGYSPQIEKTQGTNAIVTIWAAVNGNPVVRSSSTFGLVSNSVLQLPFVSLVFDLNAGDYVEFYFSSDNQYVQLTALSGLTSPTRPDSPSVIIVAKQIGLSVTDIFGGNYLPLSGGTVTGNTIFQSGLTATTISATTYYNLPVSGLTSGTGIGLSNSNGNFTISYTGSSSTFTGGTVTGATNFTNGLTANTFSATTYYNLPVSGLTSGTNIGLTNNNGNYTISFTGGTILKYFVSGSTPSGTINDGDRWFNTNDGVELVRITDGDGSQWIQPNNGGTNSGSTSVSGDYLPLSGGTVTGGTIFQNGLTADTLTTFTTGFTHNDSINVDGYSGEIIRFGAGTTYASALYYYSSSGSWSSTDANSTSTSTGMLGIGISLNNSTPGSPTTDGILIRGFAKLNYGTWTTGDKLYVADDNSGSITNVAPTTSSYVVRIIGYVVDGATDLIYFCPDNTWVQLV